MIPMFAVIRFAKGPGRKPHIWVPLFLIWLILAPLVIVLLPLAFVACLAFRINPFRACAVIWACLSATRGTHIEVNTRKASFLIHIV
jgi:hypothetical protein